MLEMNKIVKQSMIGAHTHINVLQALPGLIHDQATERTIENSHSTYELVYHMIIWQTVFIKNIKDEEEIYAKVHNVFSEIIRLYSENSNPSEFICCAYTFC